MLRWHSSGASSQTWTHNEPPSKRGLQPYSSRDPNRTRSCRQQPPPESESRKKRSRSFGGSLPAAPTSLHCDGRTQKTVALATRQPVQTNGPLEFAENRKSSAAHARTKPSHLTFLQVNRFIRRAPFGRHAREKAFGRASIRAGDGIVVNFKRNPRIGMTE